MPKTVHLVSGLPRSGSTLLVNLLAQNPRFQVAGTSGLAEMLLTVRNKWDTLAEFRAMPLEYSEAAKRRVLMGMFHAYYLIGNRVAFDKSRLWNQILPLAEICMGRCPKVLVPVRDHGAIIASLERLWQSVRGTRQTPDEAKYPVKFCSEAGRAEVWTAPDGVLGAAQARIHDAATLYREAMHFINYDDLVGYPRETMDGIYEFLGEAPFVHDFEHIEQVTQEDDRAYGLPGLHTIRNSLNGKGHTHGSEYFQDKSSQSVLADSRATTAERR